jgi:drug/metabolite transporter (DMT)-like permease
MNPHLALWLSIGLGGIAQIALKSGVGAAIGVPQPTNLTWWLQLAKSFPVWLYVACFASATGLWLIAISKLNISYAFPLLSSNFVLVAVLARFILGEVVSVRRWASIFVICVGIIVLATS